MKKQLIAATHGKPEIAYRSEKLARENIVLKLSLLAEIVKARAGLVRKVSSLDDDARQRFEPHVPRTVRQFNLWARESLPKDLQDILPNFSRNSNETLRRHPDLKGSVAEAITAFRSSDTPASPKLDRISVLRNKLSLANRLRIIAEKELISQKYRIIKLQDELVTLRAQLAECKNARVRGRA